MLVEHKSIVLVVIKLVDVSPYSNSNLRCVADKWNSGIHFVPSIPHMQLLHTQTIFFSCPVTAPAIFWETEWISACPCLVPWIYLLYESLWFADWFPEFSFLLAPLWSCYKYIHFKQSIDQFRIVIVISPDVHSMLPGWPYPLDSSRWCSITWLPLPILCSTSP